MSPLLEPPRISIFTFLFFAQYSLQAEDCTGPLKPVIWERTQNQGSSHHGYWPAYSVFILDETDKKLANGDHNYWLAQVGHTTGQGFTVMVDDCTRLIAGVQIKNLGNGFASRGYATKEFRISGSKNQSGPWETLVEDWLVDTSGVSRAAALLNYTFDKPIEIQYIRFDLVSFWELGGGLQYFAAIPVSSGPAAETTTDSAIGTTTAVEVTSRPTDETTTDSAIGTTIVEVTHATKQPSLDFEKPIGFYFLISIPVAFTIFGLGYMIRTNCKIRQKCCKCCVNLEKEDENLDYGTYYDADGERRQDVMENNLGNQATERNTQNVDDENPQSNSFDYDYYDYDYMG